MIKNLKILTITLLLSSTTFSQKDTSKVCFDYKTAQKIAVDLVKGDAAIEELGKTQKLVTQLKEKIVEKDSIISDYKTKDSVCIEQRLSFADFTPAGNRVSFDLDDFLRGNPYERAQVYEILNRIGAMSIEEIREEEDMLL